MKHIILILLVAFIGVNSFAQDRQTRQIRDFERIKVSHGIEVVLVDGPVGELTIITHFVDPDEIETYVDRGLLRIKYRSSSIWNWDDRRYKNRNVKVEVPVQELYKIEVNTGALVRSEKVISSDDFEIEATTGGELDIEIKVDRLEAYISMGAVTEVKGFARLMRVKANMGAEADFQRLQCDVVTAKASMGAMLAVSAKKEADVTSNMGAVIRVYGSPEKRYTSHGLGGEIIFERIN